MNSNSPTSVREEAYLDVSVKRLLGLESRLSSLTDRMHTILVMPTPQAKEKCSKNNPGTVAEALAHIASDFEDSCERISNLIASLEPMVGELKIL